MQMRLELRQEIHDDECRRCRVPKASDRPCASCGLEDATIGAAGSAGMAARLIDEAEADRGLRRLVKNIQDALTPELLKPAHRGQANPLAGHCYVAAEALYHAGAREAGYGPQSMRVGAVVHWFLADRSGRILDPTAAQFDGPLDYAQGRGRGFLTREPSRRARVVLSRIS